MKPTNKEKKFGALIHKLTLMMIFCFAFAYPSVSAAVDSDGDGIDDILDFDSDNDGIPDSLEMIINSLNGDIRYLHNDNNGTSNAGTVSATESAFVGQVDNQTFGSGFIQTFSSYEHVLLGSDANSFAVAKLLNEYTQVGFTPTVNATLNSIQHALVPIIWGGSTAGNYEVAVEVSTDNFATATLLYDDGFLPPILPMDYTSTFESVSFDMVANTHYQFRIYLFNEQNSIVRNGNPDVIGFDDLVMGITFNETMDLDTDSDGIPDHLDLDSDGDGILDIVEAGGTDIDGDGMVDGFTDADTNGIDDNTAGTAGPDSDLDGVPNAFDVDSDNDSIPDAIEGNIDTDGDGVADYLDTNSDNDGISDSIEAGANGALPLDTDNDGAADYLDSDSDNDNIPDNAELAGDSDSDGVADFRDSDSDDDGLPDSIETAVDSDGDGISDYLDLDSDDDSLPDAVEGSVDTDNDGTPDNLDTDSDDDGIVDAVEGNVDTDLDGIANNLDTDSDNDGILDAVENVIDTDVDGTPNYLDTDSDDDGLPDSLEGVTDSDLDGTPDNLDLDSCLLYTSPSPRDGLLSRMPSSA